MGLISVAKYVTPDNVKWVGGLANEFAGNPVLVNLLDKFRGADTTRAYATLITLSDEELKALAGAIGRINASANMKGA